MTWAQPAPPEERIETLEGEIAKLKAEIESLRAANARSEADPLTEIERKLEVLAGEIERMKLGEVAAEADRAERGFGPAASKIYRTEQGLSIGGYGEMLYEGFDSRRDDGTASGETDELDFLRGIVYFGYKFNDRWLFNSEIEFEHASTGKSGEASVEFAYLDYLWRPEVNVRTGLLLVPMGFVNELHEPTVFLGAKRPDVEQVILPTTWRESGLGLFGDVGPVTYRSYVVNGFKGEGFSSGGLRGGRQKGSKAIAEDFAWVTRVDLAATPSLLLGGSFYLGDSGQDLTLDGRPVDVGTTIFEAHAAWRYRGWEIKALAARAKLDDVAELNRALDLTGDRSVGEELEGYYLQLAYDLFARRPERRQALIPYVRFEDFDTQAKVPAGFLRDPARDVESWTYGLAYQPTDQVIFKADFQDFENGAGTGLDQLNVAVGYIF